MMLSEFIERTGFEPTADEYHRIEDAYHTFDGDKDDFCRAFVSGNGERKICKARAEEIAHLRNQMLEGEKQHKQTVTDLEHRITDLKNALDKELEWKPSTCTGTNMEQKRYEHLARAGRKMTDQEAKELIAWECGFATDKITILRKVNTYEVNKYHYLRVSAEFEREPVYEATDWNYVRFNCANYMYELINGELCFYCC